VNHGNGFRHGRRQRRQHRIRTQVSPLVWRIIAPDDPEAFEEARKNAGQQSFLGKLLGRSNSATAEVEILGAG
jgi:hypothetical protein